LVSNRFLFTGREWLSEAGLYDYRNRVYSAELGRFLQTDPIRFAAGDGNLYRYVSNNPVNLWDPWGLCEENPWLDGLQITLDGFGLIPGAGELADGANALISLARGDLAGAGLSAAAMWPVGGQAATAAKLGLKASKQAAKTGLGNPFKGKTPAQIDKMFKAKGFEPRGRDPLNGKGGYVNPKTGRSHHIDKANSFGEAPHVDVNRLKTYDGPLEKKKYFTGK
jgi:RHS repeat-associated protein